MRPVKNLVLVLCLVSFALLNLTTMASTINVPSEQTTIQAGIDAAVIGDTVANLLETIGYNVESIPCTFISPETLYITLRSPAGSFYVQL